MFTYYVAGPMTGYPGHNFAAFDAARDYLKSFDYHVLSPADHDRALGINEHTPIDKVSAIDMLNFIKWDLDAVQAADGIYMLHGWENSKGARAEHAVAVWMGKKITYEVLPHKNWFWAPDLEDACAD